MPEDIAEDIKRVKSIDREETDTEIIFRMNVKSSRERLARIWARIRTRREVGGKISRVNVLSSDFEEQENRIYNIYSVVTSVRK